MLKVVIVALASLAVSAAPPHDVTSASTSVPAGTPSASDDATPNYAIDQRLQRLKAVTRKSLTLQAVQDMNPEKTKEQCEKCTNAQSEALEKEVEAEPLAEAFAVSLEAVTNAEEAEKVAIEKEKAALDAYNKANEELAAAKEATAAAKKDEAKAAEAEAKAKEEVASAMDAVKAGCAGMNLGSFVPPPSPPPPAHAHSPHSHSPHGHSPHGHRPFFGSKADTSKKA